MTAHACRNNLELERSIRVYQEMDKRRNMKEKKQSSVSKRLVEKNHKENF